MKRWSIAVLMCLVAGCAQASHKPESTLASPRPQPAARPAPAPSAPTPTAAIRAASEAEPTMVSGTVTNVSREAGLLELRTPSGWSQFIISDPERKKDLERVTVGEKVDVKADFRTSERKVIAVLRQPPSATTGVESK